MKLLAGLILMCLSLILCSPYTFADNFYGLPEYTQEITAEFLSEESAKQAQIVICPLPDDKKIAFSIRGDDSNGNHLALANILKKYGFKASFFLNEVDQKYADNIGRSFLTAGSSAGNHSLSHPRLPDLLPNKIYTEISTHQARIESQLDTTSVSFTLPFTVLDNPADTKSKGYIAEALRRAGIFVSADGFDHGLPKEEFYTANRLKWFNGADSNPDPEQLEKAFQATRDLALHDPAYRCIFYGTHTQYNAPGLANLEKWLKIHQDDPEIWKCNANEFGAYHYSYLHANPQPEIKGKIVTFRITRFSAADLGAEVPLSVKFTQTPVLVDVNGKKIAPSPQGICDIPCLGKLPQKVGWVREEGTDTKFPGLKLKLQFDEAGNKLILSLSNKTDKPLTNIVTMFKLPLYWTEGVHHNTLEKLPSEQTKEFSIALGAKQKEAVYKEGDWQFLARIDFQQGESAGRIYVDTIKKRKISDFDCPRDRGIVVGPIPDSILTQDTLSQLSRPTSTLKNFGEKSNEKWVTMNYQAEGYREFLINAAYRGPQDKAYWQWAKETQPYFSKKEKGSRVFILDFEATTTGEAILFCPSHQNNLSQFYINGAPMKFSWKNKWIANPECSIPVKAGHNRLLFINPITSDWQAKQFGMTVKVYYPTDKKDFNYLPIVIK